MKVILKEFVNNLGEKNDIVDVKPGYGRNYLIPQGLAVIATGSAVKVAEENIRQAAHKIERIKQSAIELSEKLNGLKLVIPTKAGSNGKIFGSVTSIQIAKALQDKGFDIERRKISIKEDIKILGNYTAKVSLLRDIAAQIELEVVND
jgi:large subunit ribosomal protein L9